MYKVLLNDTGSTLEIHNETEPGRAAEIWLGLRARPLDGKRVAVVAAYNNKVFMRHRFDRKQGEDEYIPVMEQDELVRVFVEGAEKVTFGRTM